MMLNGWCLGKDGIGARIVFFFFQAEDGIRDKLVTGLQTCALPILIARDVIILALAVVFYLALGTRRFQPNLLGKVNTIVQVVAALGILASGVWRELIPIASRSEERRVGKECRSRWWSDQYNNK